MPKRSVSGMTLTIVLIGMLTLAFNIQPTKSEPTTLPIVHWSRTYGGIGDDKAYCVIQTGDGGYAFSGYTCSFGAGNQDFWLVKTGSNGETKWNMTFGGSGTDVPSSVILTTDGRYTLAGETSSFGAGSYDAWIITLISPPVANFVWAPSVPKVHESVTFDASTSMPNSGVIVKYEWNFGDEETAIGKIVSHMYANLGIYAVTLNVTNSQGLWDLEQKQVQIIQPYGPRAKFTVTPEIALVDQPIEFNASSSLPGFNGTHEMRITEYNWDFGDGNTTITSTAIVYHRYKTSRDYYVTLTVYAPGATPELDTITYRVTVASLPVGGYSISIQAPATAKPLTPYLIFTATLTIALTTIKRKTTKKTEKPP